MRLMRTTIPAAFLLTALVGATPAARAQGMFYGTGFTGYSYTGYGSTYGNYGYGGFGPGYYGQQMVNGGLIGTPYGGYYGGASMFYNQGYQMGMQPAVQPYSTPHGGGRVGGVVPYIPRLDAALPQLSPRVPVLR